MPSVNPFIDTGANQTGWDGAPVLQQSALPGAIGAPSSPGSQGVGIVHSQIIPGAGSLLNLGILGMGTANSTNAAGTSENVAMHVAIMVAVALVVVYLFRSSGFRFVAAGGVG